MAEISNPLFDPPLLGPGSEVPFLVRGGGGGSARALVNPPPPPPPAGGYAQGLRAYHGSPHDFERFDRSKIGTGEGAQAYGRGLYFAESEAVANTYRFVNAPPGLGPYPASLAKQAVDRAAKLGLQEPELKQTALRFLQEQADKAPPTGRQAIHDAINNFEQLRGGKSGHAYEVNIRAKPEEMLDWDKPLSEQPAVIDALEKTWGVPSGTRQTVLEQMGLPPNATGQDLVRAFDPQKRASTDAGIGTLTKAGIKGIRFLDQGSRGEGKGTSNYVIFDDKIIDILKKYGIAGLFGPGIAAAALPAITPSKKQEPPKPASGYAKFVRKEGT